MSQTRGGPEVAVGAVALRDGALLLIRRGQAPQAGRWSLPGGRVEWGERLSDAVVREVAEETGLVVETGSLAGVVERMHAEAGPQGAGGAGAGPGFHFVILDYFVTVTGGELRAGGDVTDARWFRGPDLAGVSLSDGLAEALAGFGVQLEAGA